MTETNNKASLGCGTLILIALIVMIFSNSNRGDDKQLRNQISTLQSSVSGLKTELASLKTDLKNQSDTLDKIKESLEVSNTRTRQPRPRVVPPASPGIPTPEAPLPAN
jgi:septal ring factor EnvC (AmiA/AmiB activator)